MASKNQANDEPIAATGKLTAPAKKRAIGQRLCDVGSLAVSATILRK